MYVNNNKKQEEMTASPTKYRQGFFNDKPCGRCGETFKPKAPSHLYCSQKCTDEKHQDNYLKRNYKISLDDFYNMFKKQNGVCAICLQEGFKIDPKTRMLIVVDHCHETGKVRGLLCHNCNRGLGLFKDKTERLKRAVNYLEGATTIP